MITADYIQRHPTCGELTAIANFPPNIPNVPRSASGRRQDLFQHYRQWLTTERANHPVSVFTLRLRDALLATASNPRGVPGEAGTLVQTATGELLEDLFCQAEPSTPALAAAQNNPHVSILEGSTAVITEVSGGENYYHWLLTALPKLLLLMYRYGQVKFDHVIVNNADTPYVAQTLEFLGVPRSAIISAAQVPVVRAREAYTARLVNGLVYPHHLLPEIFRAVFPRYFYRQRRLFISRRRGARAITNEPEVINALASLGFETLALENLSLADQIRAFASAECVVAPHGAGLANLIFAPPRTKVLELAAPRGIHMTYWFLAAACQQDYGYLLGAGEDPTVQSMQWRSDPTAPITISLPDLQRELAHLHLT